MSNQDLPPRPETLIRRKDVEQITGLSRAAIYAKTNPNNPGYDPTFPKQVRVDTKAVRWPLSEIRAWVASRIAARDAKIAA